MKPHETAAIGPGQAKNPPPQLPIAGMVHDRMTPKSAAGSKAVTAVEPSFRAQETINRRFMPQERPTPLLQSTASAQNIPASIRSESPAASDFEVSRARPSPLRIRKITPIDESSPPPIPPKSPFRRPKTLRFSDTVTTYTPENAPDLPMQPGLVEQISTSRRNHDQRIGLGIRLEPSAGHQSKASVGALFPFNVQISDSVKLPVVGDRELKTKLEQQDRGDAKVKALLECDFLGKSGPETLGALRQHHGTKTPKGKANTNPPSLPPFDFMTLGGAFAAAPGQGRSQIQLNQAGVVFARSINDDIYSTPPLPTEIKDNKNTRKQPPRPPRSPPRDSDDDHYKFFNTGNQKLSPEPPVNVQGHLTEVQKCAIVRGHIPRNRETRASRVLSTADLAQLQMEQPTKGKGKAPRSGNSNALQFALSPHTVSADTGQPELLAYDPRTGELGLESVERPGRIGEVRGIHPAFRKPVSKRPEETPVSRKRAPRVPEGTPSSVEEQIDDMIRTWSGETGVSGAEAEAGGEEERGVVVGKGVGRKGEGKVSQLARRFEG